MYQLKVLPTLWILMFTNIVERSITPQKAVFTYLGVGLTSGPLKVCFLKSSSFIKTKLSCIPTDKHFMYRQCLHFFLRIECRTSHFPLVWHEYSFLCVRWYLLKKALQLLRTKGICSMSWPILIILYWCCFNLFASASKKIARVCKCAVYVLNTTPSALWF